jgi:hypothetical protein
MASKTADDTMKTKAVAPISGPLFVRCDLTPAQKESLAAWVSTLDTAEWIGWLGATVTLGHVVSVRANDVGFQCSVTGGSRDGDAHRNQCLVARASSPVKAILVAMFKDQNVLAHIWPIVDIKSDLDI